MNRRSFVRTSLSAAAALATQTLPLATTLIANPRQSTAKPIVDSWSDQSVHACWIGHSTILINMFGTIILTDPVMFSTVGVQCLGQCVGIERLIRPAIGLADIPKPHLVLLSHAHLDHMDLQTLEYLTNKYPDEINCITAKNTRDVIDDLPWKHCRELDWWESTSVSGVDVTAVEVLHNGWRYPWDADRRAGQINGRSYNAYLLSSKDTRLLFGGDTAFTQSFRELQSIRVDCAFLPIGAYLGCSDNHCTPEEAVQMAEMMNATSVAPIHCKTFRLTSEPVDEPMHRFRTRAVSSGLNVEWTSIGESIQPTIGRDLMVQRRG